MAAWPPNGQAAELGFHHATGEPSWSPSWSGQRSAAGSYGCGASSPAICSGVCRPGTAPGLNTPRASASCRACSSSAPRSHHHQCRRPGGTPLAGLGEASRSISGPFLRHERPTAREQGAAAAGFGPLKRSGSAPDVDDQARAVGVAARSPGPRRVLAIWAVISPPRRCRAATDAD